MDHDDDDDDDDLWRPCKSLTKDKYSRLDFGLQSREIFDFYILGGFEKNERTSFSVFLRVYSGQTHDSTVMQPKKAPGRPLREGEATRTDRQDTRVGNKMRFVKKSTLQVGGIETRPREACSEL